MTKHTPGPWFYQGRAGEPGSYPQFDIGLGVWDHQGELAGQVHGCRGDEYMQVGGVCSEADARLIAAAPELLSDGWVLAVMALQSKRYSDDPDFRDAVDAMLDSCRAARGEPTRAQYLAAKAEGATP